MRWFRSIVSVLIVMMILASCSPSPSQPKPQPQPTVTPTASQPAAQTPAPTTPKATPAAVQPKSGGTLSYWIPGVPPGFDAHMKPSYAAYITLAVFNNLVYFDPTKEEATQQTVLPDLAERWEFSTDGKIVTFFLRKGVKWHDGQPFSADDVIYSMAKIMDPKRSSLLDSFPSFDRSEKIDDYTVKIYLKQPSPSFLVQLASAYANIQPKHKAGTDSRLTDFLVGTGPFKFKSYASGVSLDLVKNPDYFKKGWPYLDAVRIYIIADRNAQIDAFVANRLDLCAPISGIVNQEMMDRVKTQMPNVVINYYKPPAPLILWFNAGYAQFKDARVRKALTMLIDQKQVVTAGYGSAEWGDINRSIFTSAWGPSKAEIDKILGWDKEWDARVAEAKKLMADSGVSGLKIKLVTRNLAEYQRMAATIADMYKRHLGVEVEIKAVDTSEARKLIDARDYQLYLEPTLANTGDPDEMKSYFVTKGAQNFMDYSNTKSDQLWADQSVTMDFNKRRDLTREIERVILGDGYVVPIRGSVFAIGRWPYVKDFVVQVPGYYSSISMERVWLDK